MRPLDAWTWDRNRLDCNEYVTRPIHTSDWGGGYASVTVGHKKGWTVNNSLHICRSPIRYIVESIWEVLVDCDVKKPSVVQHLCKKHHNATEVMFG